MNDINGEYVSDDRDLLNFLPLVHSRLLRPFERMLHDRFTNLQIITLCLLRQNGEASITDLAERLCLSKQQMAKLVAQLAQNNYVKRRHPSRDHRVVLITLTDETAQILADGRERYIASLLQYISEYGDENTANRFINAVYEINSILSALPVISDTESFKLSNKETQNKDSEQN